MTTEQTEPEPKPKKRSNVSKANIKTPQELVHIRHKINLRQYKYWLLMLRAYREMYEKNLKPDTSGFFQMPIAVIEERFGYELSRDSLRDDLEAIRKEPIICNLLGKDGASVLQGAGFISEWRISAKTLAFKLPDLITQSIQNLDNTSSIFLDINWSIFNHFSGKYEAILYKLCRDYVGVSRTPYIELEKFREYMGISDDEYPLFKHLNGRVISGPVKKINESPLSDIDIEAIMDVKNRSVVGLYFKVSWRLQKSLPFELLNGLDIGAEKPEVCFDQCRVDISPKIRQGYLSLLSQADIATCIARANEYADKVISKERKSPNYGALYRTAIEAGWHNEAPKPAASPAKPETESSVRDQSPGKATKPAVDENQVLMAAFEKLPQDEKKRLLDLYQASLTLEPLRRSFLKSGLNTTAHRNFFLNFLKLQGGVTA